jgi:hypothetical protein
MTTRTVCAILALSSLSQPCRADNPPSPYRQRSGTALDEAVKAGGGNSESEAAVARGLAWLAAQQKGNGSWVTDGSHKDAIAGTGLALLPFLAHGLTHKAEPGPGVEKDYVTAVQKGLNYLKSQQKWPSGLISNNAYAHALATIALCEAFGMTQDPDLKKPAQFAVNHILECQHDGGGWRYQPKTPGDTSVTGWQVQALKAGQAAGLTVPERALGRVGVFLDGVSKNNGATYGYTDPGESPAMTAVGLWCRQSLGWGPQNPNLAKGIEYLKKHPPGAGDNYDMYYFYFATEVMHFYGGDSWTIGWNPKMRNLLIRRQLKGFSKQLDDSWEPDTMITGNAGGRLVTTCLALLTLEVYYRHPPLLRGRDEPAAPPMP